MGDVNRLPSPVAGPSVSGSNPTEQNPAAGGAAKTAAPGAPSKGRAESLPGQQSGDLQELGKLQKNMDQLLALKTATQDAAQKDDKLQKQVDLLQKQIEVQQKMIQLLLDTCKSSRLPGPRSKSCKRRSPRWRRVPSKRPSAIWNWPRPLTTSSSTKMPWNATAPLARRAQGVVLAERKQRNAFEHLRCIGVRLQQILGNSDHGRQRRRTALHTRRVLFRGVHARLPAKAQ